MQEVIGTFFLKFGQEIVLVPCMILGYLSWDKKLFFIAIYLVLLSIILNVVLKMTFKVPLSPHLDTKGFAFPSGHMQSCTVFYGGLLLNSTRKIFRVLLICLLTGIGWSLVYFRYHDYIDIIGAVFFGAGLLFIHEIILKKEFIATNLRLMIFSVSTFLILWIWKCYIVTFATWQAYYMLTGLLLGSAIFYEKMLTKNNFYIKVLSICIYLTFLAIACTFVRRIFSLLVGFCLPTSVFLSTILFRKKIVQKN